MNFCLQSARSAGKSNIDFKRFKRDVRSRFFFAGRPSRKNELFVRSEWEPPPCLTSDICQRFSAFNSSLLRSFVRRRGHSNLLPMQQSALYALHRRSDLMVWRTDKNLGPIVTTEEMYMKRALNDHLLDHATYRRIPDEAAGLQELERTRIAIANFWNRWMPTGPGRQKNWLRVFLERRMKTDMKPAHFYITAKIHKTPASTRPIVSSCGSITCALGEWVDKELQKIVKMLPFVIPSSQELLRQLAALPDLPDSARLFTFDAVSMYTRIDTNHALQTIHRFLISHVAWVFGLGIQGDKLMQALRIVMTRNIFKFDDTWWHQRTGTAMGTPPAPAYATLYFAIFELEIV